MRNVLGKIGYEYLDRYSTPISNVLSALCARYACTLGMHECCYPVMMCACDPLTPIAFLSFGSLTFIYIRKKITFKTKKEFEKE